MTTDTKEINFNEKNFECQRCSNCCRLEPGAVFLTKEDALKASKALSISLHDFLEKYCRGVYKNFKELVSLKEKKNYDCIFWNDGCTIYESRPLQCKTFPFWPFLVEDNYLWDQERKRCKGIGIKGKLTNDQKKDFYLAEKTAEIMEWPNQS